MFSYTVRSSTGILKQTIAPNMKKNVFLTPKKVCSYNLMTDLHENLSGFNYRFVSSLTLKGCTVSPLYNIYIIVKVIKSQS